MNARILIIDDDRAFRVGTGALLSDDGYQVSAAGSGEEGLGSLAAEHFDLVLLDLRMEGKDGLAVLGEIRSGGDDVPVLMLTGYGTIDTAVQALKLGADDYITKPCDNELLRSKIGAILARREPVLGAGASRIVARNGRMREVLRSIGRVAPTESTVLLRGATGTGKELVARVIHEESQRSRGAFVAVNCSALAEGVLESELFGHARGAFTGAVSDRRGLFEAAQGGTIFLDEIGDVKPSLQAKLLRVLQEREITPVGTTRPVGVDARVIAATHRDLEAEVEAGAFRSDLYFRLKVFQIRLPELKDRIEDIEPLVAAAVARWNERAAPPRRVSGWADDVLGLLQAYDWPGNVRELMTAIEHAAIVCEGGWILPSHLPDEVTDPRQESAEARGDGRRYQAPGKEEERRSIIEALEESGGNRTRAAARLGMGRTTLWQKLKEHEIEI